MIMDLRRFAGIPALRNLFVVFCRRIRYTRKQRADDGKQQRKDRVQMGTYLNPGNSAFARMRNDIYVDKTGLISLINDTIDTPRALTCISSPRRFGKSYVAKMLCAYYDKTCDSAGLFYDLAIAQDEHYLGYLAYDEENELVYIPNEEIKREFSKTIRVVKRADTIRPD